MAVLKKHPAQGMADVEKALSACPVLIDLSTARIKSALKNLGDPQERLPPVFHVAGTNGKGSILAFLQSMLEAAGMKAHKFTSPHLVRINERIVLAGREIGDEPFHELVQKALAAGRLSRFEAITAAAFLGFAQTPADAVLLETGLGGLRDATNVIARPAVTIISRLSLDHQKHLGTTLAAIAREKAGIMRPGVPCIVGAQHSKEADDALCEKAARTGALLYRSGHEWRIERNDDGRFVYEGGNLSGVYSAPGLLGPHQYENAGAVLAALEKSAVFSIPASLADDGLKKAFWPARLQRLTRGPLPRLLPPGWELWLDGAHNDSGAAALAGQIRDWQRSAPVHVVLGIKKRKDPADFVLAFQGMAVKIRTVDVPGDTSCFPAEALAARIPGAVAVRSLEEAVQDALRPMASLRGRIVIAGSLYLAGYVLQDNG